MTPTCTPIKNVAAFCKRLDMRRATFYEFKREGMPAGTEEEVEEWMALHKGRGTISDKPGEVDTENPPGIVIVDGDLTREDTVGVLARVRKNESIAWGLMDEAVQERNLARIVPLTKHYNICSDARIKTETELTKLQNTEEQLADKARLMAWDIISEVMSPLRQMLKSLPARLSPRCNPAAVEIAREVLDEEVDRIFKNMHEGTAGDGR